MKTYTLGRKKESCDILVQGSGVSRQHARLTRISPNSLLLEDLDSANGTFVNDRRILRKLIKAEDTVRLASVRIDLRKFFPPPPPPPKPDEKTPEEIKAAFMALKDEFTSFKEVEASLKDKQRIRQGIIRSIPYVGSLIATMAHHKLSTEEQLEALRLEFQQKYTCPSCQVPFPISQSWDFLRLRNKCGFCRTTFIPENEE